MSFSGEYRSGPQNELDVINRLTTDSATTIGGRGTRRQATRDFPEHHPGSRSGAPTDQWAPDEDDAPQVAPHFNQVDTLARSKLERLLELGLRDPRKTIRPPREFAVEQERRETVKAGRRFRARPRG